MITDVHANTCIASNFKTYMNDVSNLVTSAPSPILSREARLESNTYMIASC